MRCFSILSFVGYFSQTLSVVRTKLIRFLSKKRNWLGNKKSLVSYILVLRWRLHLFRKFAKRNPLSLKLLFLIHMPKTYSLLSNNQYSDWGQWSLIQSSSASPHQILKMQANQLLEALAFLKDISRVQSGLRTYIVESF